MESASETPLSDLISDHIRVNSSETYARFIEGFRQSTLGVRALGVPEGTSEDFVSTGQNPVSVGTTNHAAGRTMILAFADPAVFARRFGQKFNVGTVGESLLATALLNPDCEGVLVNSAKEEVSIIIDRKTARSLLGRGADDLPERKPWWKFWSRLAREIGYE